MLARLDKYGETTIFLGMIDKSAKPVSWVGSSKKDFLAFPGDVQDAMGFALFQAQIGQWHGSMKPLQGFGGAGVVELVENHQGDTFRSVYTVRFEEAVYVLHAFQKKSKRGVKTPPQDLALIRSRLKAAEEHHRQHQNPKGSA